MPLLLIVLWISLLPNIHFAYQYKHMPPKKTKLELIKILYYQKFNSKFYPQNLWISLCIVLFLKDRNLDNRAPI